METLDIAATVFSLLLVAIGLGVGRLYVGLRDLMDEEPPADLVDRWDER